MTTFYIIRDAKDIENLTTKNLKALLRPVCETVSKLATLLPAETALIGFAGAPWTVATYMIEGGSSKEFRKIKNWVYEAPDDLQILIDLLVDATSSYLIWQINQGSEAIQIFDTWAGVLPSNQFEKWVTTPFKKIVSNVKDKHPQIPIIGFPRGAGVQYEAFAAETGVDAVSIDSTLPLKWVQKNVQPYCVVQGNLDNVSLLVGGKQLEQEVATILDCLGNGPFVFNLGHGILPETPVKHVEKLVKLVGNS